VAGKRLLYRPLTGTTDAPPPIGIARATKGGRDTCWRKILRNLAAIGTCSFITSVKSED
jgi:hypothetical protein